MPGDQAVPHDIGTDDENGCLVRVIPPLGRPTEFQYKKYTSGKEGYLISKVIYPAGGFTSFTYKWYHPNKDRYSDGKLLSAADADRLASYIVETKTKSIGSGPSSTWKYTQFGGEGYEENGHMSWNIKRITITDPYGFTNVHYYSKGLPLREIDAAGFTTEYVWDYAKKNMLKKVTETPEFKEYMLQGALKPAWLTGPEFNAWLGQEDQLHRDLMTKGGLLKK